VIANSDLPDPQMPPAIVPTTAPQHVPQRQVNSRDILQGEREVWIVHNQDLYRLRETKNGKLILQK
jgi:hemin uptake protein HemP